LFFLSLSRPSPRPTLFPYTTLFRSPAGRVRGRRRTGRERRPAMTALPELPPRRWVFMLDRGERRNLLWIAAAAVMWRWMLAARTDRKSTRLNSSHLGISYAVFCLKK